MANLYQRCSPRPGEVCQVPVLSNVGELKPERVDPGGGRLSHGQRRVSRMEDTRELGNLTLRNLRRYEVFDLDLRKLAYSHPVATAVVLILDGGYFHSKVLPDDPAERRHRSPELSRKEGPQLVRLLVGSVRSSMNTPTRQLPSAIT